MTWFYFFTLFLHILGATIWIGGHLVLSFGYLPETLKTKSFKKLQEFENKFEKIGIPALIIQVLSGLYLSLKISPTWQSWFDWNGPFRGIGVKLILLLITVLLALDARLRVIPNLNEKNLVHLALHIIPVTFIGILFAFVGVFFRMGGI